MPSACSSAVQSIETASLFLFTAKAARQWSGDLGVRGIKILTRSSISPFSGTIALPLSNSTAVGMISNPSSGYNRVHFERVRALVAEQPAIHHVVTRCPDDIVPALEVLSRQRVELLVINGGDGTASAVLGQLLETNLFSCRPLIALLPGGTANMNAGDVGMRGRLVPAVKRLCRWCGTGDRTADSIEERCLLRVETAGESRYGMFLGAGAVIQATEYAHREIHARGLRSDLSLALVAGRTIWGLLRDDPQFMQPVSMGLRLDDGIESVGYDAVILGISSLHRLFFGIQPFWGTGPGRLRLTLITKGATRFFRTFVSIARGRPNRNAVPQSGYISHNAERIHLVTDGSLNLDGEIIRACGAVEIAPTEPLRFLRL